VVIERDSCDSDDS
jgi:hypothetical protein